MPSDPFVLAALTIGVGTGAVIDLKTRRVPNAVTAAVAAAGIGGAATGLSGIGITASLAGCALGLVLMLPGYLFGGTGGGDVKLFAAAGSLLGPAPIALAFLYTALAGGVLAIIVATKRRRLTATLDATGRLVATRAANVGAIEHPAANNRFAYAPAIAAGTLLAALGM